MMKKKKVRGGFLQMRKSDETKRRLLNKARTLFARKGFDATKTSEIARVSEVSEATIYKYFPSKIDLLLATVQMDKTNATSKEQVEGLSNEALVRQFIEENIDHIEKHLEQFNILFSEALHYPMISEYYMTHFYVKTATEAELEHRILKGDVCCLSDLTTFIVGLNAAIQAVIQHKHIHNGTELILPQKLREQVTDFCLNGFRI